MECLYELDFVRVRGYEACIQVQDTAEDCQGYGGDDDGLHVVAEPHDEDGRHGGFRQAVQDDEVRLQNLAEGLVPPKQHGDEDGEDRHQEETSEGLRQGDADVPQKVSVVIEFGGAFDHPGWTAEDKGVQQSDVGADFPGSNNKYKKKHLNKQYQTTVLFYFFHIKGLGRACREDAGCLNSGGIWHRRGGRFRSLIPQPLG